LSSNLKDTKLHQICTVKHVTNNRFATVPEFSDLP